MKNKVIESILEAEHKAEEILNTAKEESVKIVSQAENNAEISKQEAKESAKKTLKQQLEISEREAIEKFNEEISNYKTQAGGTTIEAKKNYDKAIDVILKKIN